MVEKGIPFVVTYHTTLLNKLTFIIHKNLYLLYMNQEFKNVFTAGPILPFRSAMKISSYLVSAKLCPLERTVSFKKCDKSRFEDCLNIEETDTLRLIYLLTFKCCGKGNRGNH